MWFRPRYGSVGMVGAPFYLLTEVLSPAIELVGLAALVAAVALGVFEWQTFLVVVGAMAFTNAALTAGAVLLDDMQSRLYRKRDLARILFLVVEDVVEPDDADLLGHLAPGRAAVLEGADGHHVVGAEERGGPPRAGRAQRLLRQVVSRSHAIVADVDLHGIRVEATERERFAVACEPLLCGPQRGWSGDAGEPLVAETHDV